MKRTLVEATHTMKTTLVEATDAIKTTIVEATHAMETKLEGDIRHENKPVRQHTP